MIHVLEYKVHLSSLHFGVRGSRHNNILDANDVGMRKLLQDFYFSQIVKSNNKDFTSFTEENKFSSIKTYPKFNRKLTEDMLRQRKRLYPINQRISNKELNFTIKEELAKMGITQDFKYGVYEDGLATQLKSGYFNIIVCI